MCNRLHNIQNLKTLFTIVLPSKQRVTFCSRLFSTLYDIWINTKYNDNTISYQLNEHNQQLQTGPEIVKLIHTHSRPIFPCLFHHKILLVFETTDWTLNQCWKKKKKLLNGYKTEQNSTVTKQVMDCVTYHILYIHDTSHKIIGQTLYCEWQGYSGYLVQAQVRDCTNLDVNFTVY